MKTDNSNQQKGTTMMKFNHTNPTRKIAALLTAGALVAGMPASAFAASNVIDSDGGSATSPVVVTTLTSSELPSTAPYTYDGSQPVDVDGDGKITLTDLDDTANGGNGDGKFDSNDGWYRKAPIDLDCNGRIDVSDLDDTLNGGNGNGKFDSGDYWGTRTPIDVNLDGIIDGTDLDDPINGGNGDGVFGEGDKYYSAEGTCVNVSVPGTLPLTVDASGNTATSPTLEIVNSSAAPVTVKSAVITADGGWSLSAYTDDYRNMTVNSNKLGFSLDSVGGKAQNATNGSNATTQELMQTPVKLAAAEDASGGNKAALKYSGKVSGVSEAMSNKTIASVVFTVGWAQD